MPYERNQKNVTKAQKRREQHKKKKRGEYKDRIRNEPPWLRRLAVPVKTNVIVSHAAIYHIELNGIQ